MLNESNAINLNVCRNLQFSKLCFRPNKELKYQKVLAKASQKREVKTVVEK